MIVKGIKLRTLVPLVKAPYHAFKCVCEHVRVPIWKVSQEIIVVKIKLQMCLRIRRQEEMSTHCHNSNFFLDTEIYELAHPNSLPRPTMMALTSETQTIHPQWKHSPYFG